MSIKSDFFSRGSYEVGNALNTRFWEDTWLGDKPLPDQYPLLYNIINFMNLTIADVLSTFSLNIGFRKSLSGSKRDRWLHLVSRLMNVNFTNYEDKFKCQLTTTILFTIKLMYLDMFNG
jgi:hypothetical protein